MRPRAFDIPHSSHRLGRRRNGDSILAFVLILLFSSQNTACLTERANLKLNSPEGDGPSPSTFRCDGERLDIRLLAELTRGDSTAATLRPGSVDVDIDDDGNIYVLSGLGGGVVQVFAKDGHLLREQQLADIGHRLAPGPVGMTVSGSGRINVWNVRGQEALSLSLGDGRLSSFTIFGQAAAGLPAPVAVSDSGHIAFGLEIPESDGSVSQVIRIVDTTGTDHTRLGPYPVRSAVRVRSERTISVVNLPYDLATRTVWALTPDGSILTAEPRRYFISALLGGDTTWTVQRPADTVPVSADDVEAALSLSGSTGITESAVRGLIPRTKSPVLELFASRYFLLVRRPTAGPHSYSARYDVFSLPRRSFCGTVTFQARILAVRNHRAVGLHFSPTEPTSVRVYSVQEPIG